MTEFKVGQKVRVSADCFGREGIYEIRHICNDGAIDFVGRDASRCFYPDDHLQIIEGANMYEKGKILLDPNDREREIIAVVGELVFYADGENYTFDTDQGQGGYFATPEWLEKNGWKLKEEAETTELTIDEIAKKFKLKPEQVRIKKQD